MPVLERLKAFTGLRRQPAGDDVSVTGPALAEVEARLATDREALADAEREHERRVVGWVAEGDSRALGTSESRLQALRSRLAATAATLTAVRQRHDAALAAAEAAAERERWQRVAAQIAKRGLAVSRLERAVTNLAAELRAVDAETRALATMLPAASKLPSVALPQALALRVALALYAHTDGVLPPPAPVLTSTHRLRQELSLVGDHASAAAQLLAGAPGPLPADEPPPRAA